MNPLAQTIEAGSAAIDPQATGEVPVLQELFGIRAVLFDIYGTLLISASGDIGAHASDLQQTALNEVWSRLTAENLPPPDVNELHQAIREAHVRSGQAGVDYPEVEIREIWRHVMARQARDGSDALPFERDQQIENDQWFERLVVEFELKTNPVWPMPNAASCLQFLRQRNMKLGIISNAQFYTPLAMEALFGTSLSELGFEPDCQVYSYEYGQAKPGRFLYEEACRRLERHGVEPHEVLYAGNDMRNDIAPAQAVGFRTALFAGDRRSLRWRQGDALVEGVTPDIVLTDWSQLETCLPDSNAS